MISYLSPIMLSISIILVTCLQLVSAHFSIDYPYWRGDSFAEPASQYNRPCKSFPSLSPPPPLIQNQFASPYLTTYTRTGAGVNQSLSNTNRTLWPLTGGSVVLHVSHPWAITYVNLGLGGDNTTVFNISLVPNFNQTGNGTFCLPAIKLPSNVVVSNGTQASLQVIQIGETGSSLYNVSFPPPPPPQDIEGHLWVKREKKLLICLSSFSARTSRSAPMLKSLGTTNASTPPEWVVSPLAHRHHLAAVEATKLHRLPHRLHQRLHLPELMGPLRWECKCSGLPLLLLG